MSENNKTKEPSHSPGIGYAIPFFLALTILTVVSFCIPLRPTQSNTEKRNLAQFPEFSVEALLSGDYFDDITLWFSDTFPGREGWLTLSSNISALHGYSEIAIEGDLPVMETIPEIPKEVEPLPSVVEETAGEETTGATEPQQWGGVDAGNEAEINLGAVIQIGDTAFNAQGFSEPYSRKYAETLTAFAEKMTPLGVNVISAPIPTAVGIMVEEEYLAQLNCAPQDDIIDFMHDNMSDDIIKIDTFGALIDHNDEYIYFRTDHHWTALGAYYVYEELCKTMGYEAAPLESFEEFDQGTFEGSIYFKAKYHRKLKKDNVMAYIPQGDIQMLIYKDSAIGYEMPLIADTTQRELNTKYLTFMSSDNPLSVVTNHSLPDAPNCIVIKDSFGNCFVPFLTQNYHKIYAIDYRKFKASTVSYIAEHYDIDDVIIAPYLTATQAIDGNNMFAAKLR
ncbi:MAG: hypothetical protein IJN67_14255 [Oscillospiraceae bacterium]|nr:hypothetical protein [Oscillospiraceae bacterium]